MPLLFCLLGLSSFVVFLSRVVTSSSAVAERPRDALCPSVKYLEGSVLLLRHQLRTIKRCSVVFGVMLSQVKSSSLMLLVTNTSPSSTAVNKLRYQLAMVRHSWMCCTCRSCLPLKSSVHDGARYWLRIVISAYSTCIRRIRYGEGFPSEYYHGVWCGKTKMVWLHDGEKNWS